MLRLTARYADALNTVWYGDAAGVVGPFRRLEAACREVGRDPATIGPTAGAYVALSSPDVIPGGPPVQTVTGPPELIAERLRAFYAAGVEHLTIVLDPWTVRGIERFGEVIAALG